jgi:hypothetical protein
MSDYRTVKGVTKIFLKYSITDERAWKAEKCLLNLYKSQLIIQKKWSEERAGRTGKFWKYVVFSSNFFTKSSILVWTLIIL